MKKVSNSAVIALAAPALPMAGLTLPLVTFLPEHYAHGLGLNLTVVGLVFMVVRLLDISFDPILGGWMDRTRTRWGRFKPWLAGGVPLIMGGVAMLFFAPPGIGPLYLAAALLITYAGYSIIVLSQLALSAGVSDDYHERSRVFAWWQAATTGGIVLVLMLPSFIGSTSAGSFPVIHAMGLFIIILTPVTVGTTLFRVKDHTRPMAASRSGLREYFALLRRSATRRLIGANLLMGLATGITAATGIMFFVAAKGLTISQVGITMLAYFAFAIISAPLWTRIARRIEKHRALALGASLYVVFLIVSWLVPSGRFDLLVGATVIGGISFTATSLLPNAMLADIGDEELLDNGVEPTGLLYSMQIGIHKVGQAVAIGIVYVVLDLIGFDVAAGPGNSAASLKGVMMVYSLIPALLTAAGAMLMIRYPLTAARHAEVRAALDRAA